MATRLRLAEPICQGLLRDVEMAVSSYIELSAGGHPAEWPSRRLPIETDFDIALDALSASIDMDAEKIARDAVARVSRRIDVRPIVFARARDAAIIRNPNGRYAAVLNCIRASDARSKVAHIESGVDPTTGEVVKEGTSKTKLVIPIACSKWHENKFFNGRAILRSSLVFRRGDRWYLASQFEMPETKAALTGASLGVDRGVVFPVSTAVVDRTGAVIDLMAPQGEVIGEVIRLSDERRRGEQKRRGVSTFRHQNVVNHALHRIANDIVAAAKRYGAEVTIEALGGQKKTITSKRTKGARRNPWQNILKRVQLGKLEQILSYKLALAGLPKLREVFAHGTSQTCPACGHRARENRVTRDVFCCVKCGHTAHADQNAAIVIARRGVLMRTLKKGDKYDVLHQNMVARLSARDDDGLGRKVLYLPVVPAHVSEPRCMTGGLQLSLDLEQKVTFVEQNASMGVFAARLDAKPAREVRENQHQNIGLS